MKTLKAVSGKVDEILFNIPKPLQSKAFRHLYGVSDIAAMLAIKRGENPKLAAIAGMLHDMFRYETGESANHAERGAERAEELLTCLEIMTREEIRAVTETIRHHSEKSSKGTAADEILKDADSLSHYLMRGLQASSEQEEERVRRVMQEFGIGSLPEDEKEETKSCPYI